MRRDREAGRMVSEFIRACDRSAPGNRVPFTDLYAAYVSFCEARAEQPWRPAPFGAALTRAGVGKEGTYRTGVRAPVAEHDRVLDVPLYDDLGNPQPPAHLSASSRAWVLQLTETYGELVTETALTVAVLTREAWDRRQRARDAWKDLDPTIENSETGQTVARPEIAIERSAGLEHTAHLKMLAEILGISLSELP